MAKKTVRVAVGAIGALVSLALIALVFFRIDIQPVRLVARFSISAWIAELPGHLIWVLPFLVLTAALAPLRAALWGATLPTPVPAYGTRLLAIALGGLVHNVLPGRLGLLGSAFVLARRAKRPVAESFAALLLMKLLELGALVAATAALLFALRSRGVVGSSVGGGLERLVGAGAVALLIFSAATLALSRWIPRDAATATERPRLRRVLALLAQLGAGLDAVGSPRRLVAGLLIGLGPMAASSLAFGLALAHMGAPAGVWGGGLLLAAITLAQFTPGLPIGTGVYYTVAAWAARQLGVGAADAAALAALTHAATVVSHLSVGLAAAIAHRRELPALLPRRRRSEA